MIRFKTVRLFLFIFFLIIAFQGHTSGKQLIKKDTVSLEKIEIPNSSLQDFKQNNSFKYSKVSASPGLLQRILIQISEWFGFKYVASAAPWIMYSILFLAFITLVIVLFRSHFQGIFFRNDNEPGLNISSNEISENINFEALLDNALKIKDYNLAVRYLYLLLLRTLNQKKIINYRLGKTNFEYIKEISNKDILPYFKTVTRNYEYAWYGQFLLNEQSYKEIESDYKHLSQKLNG